MTIFYFTGTGNSLFAACKIADSTGAKLISIPQAIHESKLYTDDCIGFVYPQYANGLPKMVRNFISNNEFKAEYFFAINLCPEHAIYANNATLKHRQYRNPFVPSNEIARVNSIEDEL